MMVSNLTLIVSCNTWVLHGSAFTRIKWGENKIAAHLFAVTGICHLSGKVSKSAEIGRSFDRNEIIFALFFFWDTV